MNIFWVVHIFSSWWVNCNMLLWSHFPFSSFITRIKDIINNTFRDCVAHFDDMEEIHFLSIDRCVAFQLSMFHVCYEILALRYCRLFACLQNIFAGMHSSGDLWLWTQRLWAEGKNHRPAHRCLHTFYFSKRSDDALVSNFSAYFLGHTGV